MIDTKAIRTKLMRERVGEHHPKASNDSYYDGVMDALIEIEKEQKANHGS